MVLSDERAGEIIRRYLQHLWEGRLKEEGSKALEAIRGEVAIAAKEIGIPFEEIEAVFKSIASEALANVFSM